MAGKIRAVVAIVWLSYILPTKCLNDIECYTRADGTDYRGHVSMTENGKQCQQWTSQSPQEHSRTPEEYPSFGLGPHNYCRNPDDEPGPWCYTTDPLDRFRPCEVGKPQIGCDTDSLCYQPLGMEDKRITDDQITASNYYTWHKDDGSEAVYTPNWARLNVDWAWVTHMTDTNQWIQIKFNQDRLISGFITQGYSDAWVESYKVQLYSPLEAVTTWQYLTDRKGQEKIFLANTDVDTAVTNMFSNRVLVKAIRINPQTWTNWIHVRMEILGCSSDCLNLIGMKNKTIPDSSITASSALIDPNDNVFVYSGYQGRLDASEFWLPVEAPSSWVQVDFGYPSIKVINGIITQGSTWWDRWVETLQVKYGNDTAAPLNTILENDIPKTFDANTNASTHKTILFPATIRASVLRILPITWHVSVGLRWEILGCNSESSPTFLALTPPASTSSTTSPSKMEFASLTRDAQLDTWTLSIIGLAILIVIAIAVGCLVLLAIRKKRRHESEEFLELQRPCTRGCTGKAESNSYEDYNATPARPVFSKHEITRAMLKMGDAISNGAFGVVYQAVLSGRNDGKIVAVKCLKENASSETKENFLNEIELIIEIGNHPNILPIVGCITSSEPYYLVTEYMKNGDLLDFLRKSKLQQSGIEDDTYYLSEVNKLQIERQIACGMDFLSSTRYYHGDLAARNILVGEGLVVKICDFGLADDIYTMDVMELSPQKKRAVKWVSLEANLHGQCTIMSDVWSYGIVLYEIETLGDVPYPAMDPHTVLQQLKIGYRMEKPENCSTEVYEIMRNCWLEDPNVRPTFKDLLRSVDNLLARTSSYLDMDDMVAVVNAEYEEMPLQTDTPLLHSANNTSDHELHVDVVSDHELHVDTALGNERGSTFHSAVEQIY